MFGKPTLQYVLTILTIGIVFLIILAYPGNQLLFSQNSEVLSPSPIPTETINIVKPITTQNVSTGEGLIISGLSSDDTLKNCSVSVIINDVRPYQIAVAKGMGGTNDFSQWEFVLGANYTQIIQGENKITSKLLCPPAPTRWYSVFVNGVPNYSNEEISSPVQPEEQPAGNLSVQPEEQPAGNLSVQPEEQPAGNLSVQPEEQPTGNLSVQPEEQHTGNLSVQPEEQ